MAERFGAPRLQWEDGNGAPLAGGKLYFYAAGTTTPQATYSDEALAVPNPNPVVLNSQGYSGDIWVPAGSSYKVVLKTAADVEVWTVDPWEPPGAGSLGLPAFGGQALRFMRVNAVETALEFRTPAQVKSDIAAGDVSGPASAVDNAVAVADGTTGKLIKYVAAVGSAGQLLTSQGPGLPPVFASPSIGALTHLESQAALVATASLDFDLTPWIADYEVIEFEIDLLPVDDDAVLQVRLSADNGVTFDASGYNYAAHEVSDAGVESMIVSGSAAAMFLANPGGTGEGVGNGAAEGWSGRVTIRQPGLATRWPRIKFEGTYINAEATPGTSDIGGSGAREAAQATDAIRFMFDTGNIASGTIRMYGRRTA